MMSKIEEYKRLRAVAQRIRVDVNRALGRDPETGARDHRNDKHIAQARFIQQSSSSCNPLEFAIDLSYGYCGSSSGYSVTSREIGAYLQRAINEKMPSLLERCVALAREEAEAARKAAEDEAREVLNETQAVAAK